MKPQTKSSFGGNKEGMIAAMIPVIHEIGMKALQDEKLFTKLNHALDMARPKISDDLITEQTVFAILAIKKYNISIDEAYKLILDIRAVEYCFERFSEAGDLDDLLGGKNSDQTNSKNVH